MAAIPWILLFDTFTEQLRRTREHEILSDQKHQINLIVWLLRCTSTFGFAFPCFTREAANLIVIWMFVYMLVSSSLGTVCDRNELLLSYSLIDFPFSWLQIDNIGCDTSFIFIISKNCISNFILHCILHFTWHTWKFQSGLQWNPCCVVRIFNNKSHIKSFSMKPYSKCLKFQFDFFKFWLLKFSIIEWCWLACNAAFLFILPMIKILIFVNIKVLSI